jgi:3-methyladenine DNA glycosylase/8-oxoguanine DNA glycosylase
VTRAAELALRGAGGEPVDFARTIVSHGVAELPPNRVDLEARTLETTLPVPRGARTVRISADGATLRIDIVAGTFHKQLAETVAHMFRLDEDLSRFYELVSNDGELSWCALGAGRMLRAPTVFGMNVQFVFTTSSELPREVPRAHPKEGRSSAVFSCKSVLEEASALARQTVP